MVEKSQKAYRNITEVAEILELKPHVLRFWESKFDAIQPMTRGGGRRYYSPEDIALLETTKELLYERGLTIKAASQLLDKYGTNAIYLAPPKIEDNTAKTSGARAKAAKPSKAGASHAKIVKKLDAMENELQRLEEHARSAIARYNHMIENIKAA